MHNANYRWYLYNTNGYTHIFTEISPLEGSKYLAQGDCYCHILVSAICHKYCPGNGGKGLIPKEKRNMFRVMEVND